MTITIKQTNGTTSTFTNVIRLFYMADFVIIRLENKQKATFPINAILELEVK